MKVSRDNYLQDLYYLFLYTLERDLEYLPVRVKGKKYFEIQVKVLTYIDTAKYLRQHSIRNYLMRLNDVISKRDDELIISLSKMIQSECKKIVSECA
jgi:predicted RNA-binding protein